MQTKYLIAGGGVFCVILIISAFLIGFSFRIIEVDQYGILYNKHTKSLKNETYQSGRKFAGLLQFEIFFKQGLGKSFKKFSLAVHNVDFTSDSVETKNIGCWTKNGVNMYISLGYFYRIIKDKAYDLYMTYGTEDEHTWQIPLIRATETAVKETTTKHNTIEFFENRDLIKSDILASIKSKVNSSLDFSIEIIDLQLRSIDIDEDFESAIINKLIQYQELRTYQIEQEAAKILKQTELIEAYAASNITLIQVFYKKIKQHFCKAEATAKGNILLAQARADVFLGKIKNEAEQYAIFKTALGNHLNLNFQGFDNQKLQKFIYINEMSQYKPNGTLLNPKQVMIKHQIF